MPPKKKGLHRHHIIPKHCGGEDNNENIVYLTPEEHAKEHLRLFETYGLYADAQAYNSLKKYWLGARKLDGYKQTTSHIQKRINSIDYSVVSKKLKNRVSPTKGMTFPYKPRPKTSIALMGKLKSNETKQKISKSLEGKIPGNKIEFYCLYCRTRIAPSRIDRHGVGKKECMRHFGLVKD